MNLIHDGHPAIGWSYYYLNPDRLRLYKSLRLFMGMGIITSYTNVYYLKGISVTEVDNLLQYDSSFCALSGNRDGESVSESYAIVF